MSTVNYVALAVAVVLGILYLARRRSRLHREDGD